MRKRVSEVCVDDVLGGWRVLYKAWVVTGEVILILENPVPSRGTMWEIHNGFDEVEVDV